MLWMITELVSVELATRRGAATARTDIARGEFRYRLRGKAHGWDRAAIQIAARDYGIHMERTGGCFGGNAESAYDSAYNNAMADLWPQKFGFDPIDKAFELARTHDEAERVRRYRLHDTDRLLQDVP